MELKTLGEKRHMSSEPKPKRTSKFLLVVIPAALLIGFACLVFWRVQARLRVQAQLIPVATESNLIPVSIMHPIRSAADQDLTLPGNVQAYVETPIYARTNGYLKKWYVDIGGRVKEGQLLATIDTPEVDQQLNQAQAALLQAQASMDLAKTTAERYQNLLKSDGVSQQEVDQNNGAYKVADANVNAAKANLERLKYLQSFQNVTAPFDGVLTARNVDIGALISDGNTQPLFQLAQVSVLRIYVNVPEPYSNDINPGLTTQLHIAEFPNNIFAGKVVHTAGAIDPASRTLLTEVQVPNPKEQLMPGAYAEVKFHIHSGVVPLLVPSTALIFRSDGAQVALVDSDNKAHLRSVTIGRDFGSNLEIISGLQPDDQVIVNPPDSISEGAPVAVQTQPPATSPVSQAPPSGEHK
jgi:RND family efflux transporter MFP subunit